MFGPDGRLKDRREVRNIVTNAGRQLIIDRLQGSSPNPADYIAISTGATAAAAADTALQTEVAPCFKRPASVMLPVPVPQAESQLPRLNAPRSLSTISHAAGVIVTDLLMAVPPTPDPFG